MLQYGTIHVWCRSPISIVHNWASYLFSNKVPYRCNIVAKVNTKLLEKLQEEDRYWIL